MSHFVQTESARKTEYISEDYQTQKPTEPLQNFYLFGNCHCFQLRDAAANSVVDPDLQDLYVFGPPGSRSVMICRDPDPTINMQQK